MAIRSLQEYHLQAKEEGWAIPHFNFAELSQLNGICDAVREYGAPVLVGTSEGERAFFGMKQAVALIRSFREEEGLPVFLNADHCRSAESAKEACDAGYDSVHIDLSKESHEDNETGTKDVVSYAKKNNPKIHVEGELGYFATDSSKLYKEDVEIPEESYTNPDQAAEFILATGIDRLASAVGTIHGIARNAPTLRLNIIQALAEAVPKEVALVLHGGSGVKDGDMKKAVQAGITNIHVSTEMRVAYADALRESLRSNPDELAPYRYLGGARDAVKELAQRKMKLFGCPRNT